METRAWGFVAATICATTLVVSGGCSARKAIPPAKPYPEVRFIPPGDPAAVIALSADDELRLVDRDRLLRERIRVLEGLLEGD